VPIFLAYWTAWVNELNELNIRDDVYDGDIRLGNVLAAQEAKRRVRFVE
jgi:murein L,D-transpeptidase YcbB/YkuD